MRSLNWFKKKSLGVFFLFLFLFVCLFFFFFFFIVLMDKIWRRITKLEIWRDTIKFRSFRFCFWESFNLWLSLLMIVFYYQTKTLVNFLCRQGLNLIYLIQLLETLPVELTGTHNHTISVETILFQFYIITRCVLFLLFT